MRTRVTIALSLALVAACNDNVEPDPQEEIDPTEQIEEPGEDCHPDWTSASALGGSFRFPDTYEANRNTGCDTTTFSARRDDGRVVFWAEEGPGTPYEPASLSDPLAESFEEFDTLVVVPKCDERGTAGVMYTYTDPDNEFRNVAGWFFKGELDYRQMVRLSYASSEESELLEILSTVGL